MGSRVKPVKARILCVNCNICVNTLRRYRALELEPVATSVICTWVYPRTILEDDFVCEPCRDLAIAAVNNSTKTEVSDNQETGPKTKGHSKVCLLCGRSLLRRQSDKLVIDNPTEMQKTMVNFVQSKVEPREISAPDRVCHACWLKVRREVNRSNSQDERRPQSDVEAYVPQTASTTREETQIIALPNYRRAPNSNHSCVIPNCTSTSFHNISDKLRAMVLHEHKFYLPKLARICSEHLKSTNWDTLFNSKKSKDTFNVEHIEHVFSLVNADKPSFDFEYVEDIDDRVFEYLLGMTKENFNVLINEIESKSDMRRASVGLAAHLLKIKSGNSNQTIATLFQVPRRTLENLMDLVSKILGQGSVEAMVVAENEK